MSTCPICYEDITATTGQVTLGCSHSYHLTCVVEWLFHHDTCPCCRREVGETERVSDLIEDEEDDEDIWPAEGSDDDEDDEEVAVTNVNAIASAFRAEIMAHLPNPEDFENIIDVIRGDGEFRVIVATSPGVTTAYNWEIAPPAPAPVPAGGPSNSWMRTADGWRLRSDLANEPTAFEPLRLWVSASAVPVEPLGTLRADAPEFIPTALRASPEWQAAQKIQAIIRGWRVREMVRLIRSN